MFKLFVFVVLAFAAVSVDASAAYYAGSPVVSAYSAPVVSGYGTPLAYNAYSSPLAYSSPYALPYAYRAGLTYV